MKKSEQKIWKVEKYPLSLHPQTRKQQSFQASKIAETPDSNAVALLV
ncbi:MAG: hypothetical protein K6E86_01150 [Bacteroidales bacterium]|nr:hypothetical protein [Bacteroidales bacterium]